MSNEDILSGLAEIVEEIAGVDAAPFSSFSSLSKWKYFLLILPVILNIYRAIFFSGLSSLAKSRCREVLFLEGAWQNPHFTPRAAFQVSICLFIYRWRSGAYSHHSFTPVSPAPKTP